MIGIYLLCIIFGLSLGTLIGYYLRWLEYRPVIGYLPAARKYEALKERFERGELK